MYALAVVAGAFANSTIGKAFDGQKLLFLCALLMLVVGVLMLRGRGEPGNLDVQCRRENALKVIAYGSATGLFLGFLGIGGGFLIAPGLMASTGMPMINGVGSSLVAVAAFGLRAAINYAVRLDRLGACAAFRGGCVGSLQDHRIAAGCRPEYALPRVSCRW